MDSYDPQNDLNVKQEPEEESPEISSMLDANLEVIEFCAVKEIKEEYLAQDDIKTELVEFDYNHQRGSINETTVTSSSSLVEYNKAISSRIKKPEIRDDYDNKNVLKKQFVKKYEQLENTGQSNAFLEAKKKNVNEKSFICDMCGKSFCNRRSIYTHVRIHEEKVYKCTICEHYLGHRSGLNHHIQAHQRAKNYKCNICLKYFSSSSALNLHLLTHRDIKFECDICRCKFTQKVSVAFHIKEVHINSKEFQCVMCKKHFTRKSNLKKHMVTHGVPSEHQCHVCNKYFGQAQHLREHLATHTNVKSFKCNLCDKQFIVKRYLNIHMEVHKNVKYTCNICKKTLNCKRYLSNHLKTHKGDLLISMSGV